VPPGKPELLAECIRKISQNKDYFRFIGKQARKVVEECYTIWNHTKIIEIIYSKIIKD